MHNSTSQNAIHQQWYFTQNGQRFGPMSFADLTEAFRYGHWNLDEALLWREGMNDWLPPRKVPEIQAMLNVQPPQSSVNPSVLPAPITGDPYAPQPVPSSVGYQQHPYGQQNVGQAYNGLPRVQPVQRLGVADAVKNVNTKLFIALWSILLGLGFVGTMVASSKDDTIAILGGILVGISVVMAIIGSVMGYVYLHRMWKLIQPYTTKATPGQAVGFMFIPFFNFYWVFVAHVSWASEVNRIVPQVAPTAPRASSGLAVAYSISWLITMVSLSFLVGSVWVFFAFIMFSAPTAFIVGIIYYAKAAKIINWAVDQHGGYLEAPEQLKAAMRQQREQQAAGGQSAATVNVQQPIMQGSTEAPTEAAETKPEVGAANHAAGYETPTQPASEATVRDLTTSPYAPK